MSHLESILNSRWTTPTSRQDFCHTFRGNTQVCFLKKLRGLDWWMNSHCKSHGYSLSKSIILNSLDHCTVIISNWNCCYMIVEVEEFIAICVTNVVTNGIFMILMKNYSTSALVELVLLLKQYGSFWARNSWCFDNWLKRLELYCLLSKIAYWGEEWFRW